jgi:hypothetical protein
MHAAARPSRFLLPALCGLAATAALAQPPAAQPRDGAPPPNGAPEQKIERIRHQDAGSRIDELRVGGESRQITVQPKGEAPAYEVAPESNNRNPAATDRERSGKGGWNLFKF